MDTREFEAIQKKAETIKEKSIRASANLDTLNADLIAKYGTDDLVKLEAIVAENEKFVTETEAKIDEYYEELKGLTNWSFV